jgi:pimeloyl-ACP methyl ester carboxylesterase
VALACAAAAPERVASLALLEPAWAGAEEMSAAERAAWLELERIEELPDAELMRAFMRLAIRPGVALPEPAAGEAPPWMATRPAGIRALLRAFRREKLDLASLRRFDRPVYFALGGLSNPDQYGEIAERLGRVLPDFTLEVFELRHHFDPPHRVEPERLAASLAALWARAPA